MNKRILFVNNHAPYGSSLAKESLDALLASSAFDQDLSVLFCGDGVFQLLKQQAPEAIEQKNLSKTLPVLEMYDIDQLFVQSSALNARGLTSDDLCIDAKPLSDEQITSLTQQQDCVLSF